MTDFVAVQRLDTFDTWRAQTNVLGSNVGAISGLNANFSGHNTDVITAVNYLQTSLSVVSAGTLTGTTLASNVVISSLTTVGTIGTGVWHGSIIAGQYGGTGVANTGKTIMLGGNLTTSGAFPTTLTVTAATNVTLPTSGTLAVNNQTFYLGTTAININQGAGTLTLPNTSLTNSSVTIGSTSVSLGSTVTAFAGLTTLNMSGQLTNTIATGTAPFIISSTTNVANLNASSLKGATFAAPGSIGATTPGTGAFTTLSSTGVATIKRLNTSIITTSTTAVAGTTYVCTASLILTLPASPAVGDVVKFINASGTKTCTINPGTNYIMRVSGIMTVDTINANFTLQYSGNSTTPGWVFI